jgi:2'-hydroxyisoflavone reductase
VAQALERGHAVTLLHRGASASGLFPQAEHRLADRNGGPRRRAVGGTWDVAIDTNAYVPRHVDTAAAVLAGRVGCYQLVSTISVYADDADDLEDSPQAALADPATEEITGATYGGLKALCARRRPGATSAPRPAWSCGPGSIVGPFDPTGRFSWWVQRLLRGGEVLAPGDPAAPVQFIDALDLATWMLLRAEGGGTGCFHLTGPRSGTTMGEWLETARAVLNPGATLTWIDEAMLLAAGVAPWMELPLWLPAAQSALHQTTIERALGLRAGHMAAGPDAARDGGWGGPPCPQRAGDAAANGRRARAPAARPCARGRAAGRVAGALSRWAAAPGAQPAGDCGLSAQQAVRGGEAASRRSGPAMRCGCLQRDPSVPDVGSPLEGDRHVQPSRQARHPRRPRHGRDPGHAGLRRRAGQPRWPGPGDGRHEGRAGGHVDSGDTRLSA